MGGGAGGKRIRVNWWEGHWDIANKGFQWMVCLSSSGPLPFQAFMFVVVAGVNRFEIVSRGGTVDPILCQ